MNTLQHIECCLNQAEPFLLLTTQQMCYLASFTYDLFLHAHIPWPWGVNMYAYNYSYTHVNNYIYCVIIGDLPQEEEPS